MENKTQDIGQFTITPLTENSVLVLNRQTMECAEFGRDALDHTLTKALEAFWHVNF